MHTWRPYLQLTGATMDSSLPAVSVTNDQRVVVFVPLAALAVDVFVDFSLQCHC